MDLGVAEELNFEESGPEDDLDESGGRNDAGDSAKDDTKQMDPDEQYLQIDYLEDENLSGEETPLEAAPTEAKNDGKAAEENEKPEREGVSPADKEANPSSQSTVVSGHQTKRKKHSGTLEKKCRRFLNKKFRKSLCLNPWLPEDNLGQLATQRQFFSNSSMLNLNQFYQIHKQMANRFLQLPTFSPNGTFWGGGCGLGFSQMSNNFAPGVVGQSFTYQLSNYQRENGKMAGSFGFQNVAADQNKNFSGGMNQTSVANKETKNGQIVGGFYNRHAGVASPKKDDPFPTVQYKALEEEEKKALMLKKEARLKRFMQDEVLRKDKLTDSGLQPFQESSPSAKYVQKEEKKVLKKENSSSENESLQGKPEINKESLLRKVNPFGGNLGITKKITKTEATTEVRVKVERDDSKGCTTPEAKASTSPCPGPVKTEKEPHVKFVRTISKSFDELTCRKPKTETAPEESPPRGKVFPFAGHRPCCVENKIPKQLEPQLTGCIVKVLNIPPSTTTNDILALCSPIGIVMEVKLNCPKENSVVIRFAEPKCAENFFSLYHGQKMNNYFLNVIVV